MCWILINMYSCGAGTGEKNRRVSFSTPSNPVVMTKEQITASLSIRSNRMPAKSTDCTAFESA